MGLPEDFGSHYVLVLSHGLGVILVKMHPDPACAGPEHQQQTPRRARRDAAASAGALVQRSASSLLPSKVSAGPCPRARRCQPTPCYQHCAAPEHVPSNPLGEEPLHGVWERDRPEWKVQSNRPGMGSTFFFHSTALDSHSAIALLSLGG